MTERPRPPTGHAAVVEHYRSVDSAPALYSQAEPPARVNGFFVSFAATSVLLQAVLTVMVHAGLASPNHDLMFFTDGGQQSLIPARLFLVTFFAVFAFWIDTNGWRRLLVGVQLVGGTLVAAFLIDLFAWLLNALVLVEVQAYTQQVLTALLAMVLFPAVLTRHAVLPPAGPDPPRPVRGISVSQWARLVIPLLLAFALAIWAEVRWMPVIDWMRTWALLGGVGPGLFLVQQAFTLQTAVIGLWIVRRSRRRNHAFAPDIGVIVPAHNEAHDIAATIDAVAAAARSYRGKVHLYVVDNASTDGTAEVARATIAGADGLTGEVLECEHPGKAIALNHGLARITEDFVVRIDADTVVSAACLDRALLHLADPTVGAVGGLPLPSSHRGSLDRVRLVEVLLRHGYFQMGLLGYGGILGVPGMFTVYRKSALDAVGDLVQGMNGEDTDICLRISAAGYRVVVDPSAVYYSETPQSWAHLREQRQRWFRSIYHVAGHNRHLIFDTRSMASAATLPFQLASAGRRAMLAPMLVAAFIALVIFPTTFTALHWAPIVATVLGLPFLMAVIVCVIWRRWRALLYVPEYLVFRVVRSYFTVAAALTLVLPPLHPRRPRRPRFGR